MNKILILALCLGFGLTQSIQTKQAEITITDLSNLEIIYDNDEDFYYGINVNEHISLFEGEYLLQLISIQSPDDILGIFRANNCNGTDSGFWWANFDYGPSGVDVYGGEPLRISYDCSYMLLEGDNHQLESLLEQTSSLSLKFWVTGMFEDELLPPTGDLNLDGEVNVADVVALVNTILQG